MVDVKCKSVTVQTQAGGGLEPGYSPGCHYPHDPGTSQLGLVDLYTVDISMVEIYTVNCRYSVDISKVDIEIYTFEMYCRYIYSAGICAYLFIVLQCR